MFNKPNFINMSNVKKTEESTKQKNDKDSSVKEPKLKFDFNPIEVKVKKYNLRFPIDGMF